MTARLSLECQFVTQEQASLPSPQEFECWAKRSLAGTGGDFSLLIRVVDAEESRNLNGRYRDRDEPTNVLSFPLLVDDETGAKHLGDLVICEPIVVEQAREQGKVPKAHWAHMTVHGVLHLLGFDHKHQAEAAKMEAMEVEILASLGYQDPYNS